MSGNDKLFAAKKRQQDAQVERQTFKQRRLTACDPSSSDSMTQTSAVAQTSAEEETEDNTDPKDDTGPDTAIRPGR